MRRRRPCRQTFLFYLGGVVIVKFVFRREFPKHLRLRELRGSVEFCQGDVGETGRAVMDAWRDIGNCLAVLGYWGEVKVRPVFDEKTEREVAFEMTLEVRFPHVQFAQAVAPNEEMPEQAKKILEKASGSLQLVDSLLHSLYRLNQHGQGGWKVILTTGFSLPDFSMNWHEVDTTGENGRAGVVGGLVFHSSGKPSLGMFDYPSSAYTDDPEGWSLHT